MENKKDLKKLLKGLTKEDLNKIELNNITMAAMFDCSERQASTYISKGCPKFLCQAILWFVNYQVKNDKSTKYINSNGSKEDISLKDKKESLIIEKLEEQLKEIRKESIDISKHNEILNSRATQLKTFLLESLDRNAFHFANQDVDNVRDELRTFAEKFIEQYIASAESEDD